MKTPKSRKTTLLDEAVGFIFSRTWGKVGWFGTFSVLPEFQGQGIGQSADACSEKFAQTFSIRTQNWFEYLLPEGFAENITFFDYALHRAPKNLRSTIQDVINNIQQPSLIVLGYGLYGNGLPDIQAGKHTLLIPRTDDCIAIILGSHQSYRREFDKEPATYYLSKGWLEGGSTPLQEYRELVEKYGQKKADWLMGYQYHNYKRLALIVQNSQHLSTCRPAALEVAKYCERWGMRYEELIGTDAMLRHLIEIAAGLDQVDNDFLVVPPGGVLNQTQFFR